MANYSRLTKAELLHIIEQLEDKTLESRIQYFKKEVVLLGRDLLKITEYVYDAGYKAGSYFYNTFPTIKKVLTLN